MNENEAIETLVEYLSVVRDVVNSYTNDEIGVDELKELVEGMGNVLDSFAEAE